MSKTIREQLIEQGLIVPAKPTPPKRKPKPRKKAKGKKQPVMRTKPDLRAMYADKAKRLGVSVDYYIANYVKYVDVNTASYKIGISNWGMA